MGSAQQCVATVAGGDGTEDRQQFKLLPIAIQTMGGCPRTRCTSPSLTPALRQAPCVCRLHTQGGFATAVSALTQFENIGRGGAGCQWSTHPHSTLTTRDERLWMSGLETGTGRDQASPWHWFCIPLTGTSRQQDGRWRTWNGHPMDGRM